MSELARNEYNEDRTAFSLRDEFLRTGTTYQQFNCSFCDVDLITVAVAPDLTYKRPPHFRLADNNIPHASDCPYGAAGLARYGIVRAPAQKHEFDLDLPESLVPIRPPRAADTPLRPKPTALASPEEVRRRAYAGVRIATTANQYTTSLLKTLSDARYVAMDKLFNEPKIAAIASAKDRSKKVFSLLAQYPLNLYGTLRNYNSAFHKTARKPWNGPFIYHGNATVLSTPTGFLLTSGDSIPDDAAGAAPGAVIPAHIYVNCDVAAPVNRLERRTVDTLTMALAAGRTVGWYAYGELKINADRSAYELHVNSPEHISV